MEEKHMLKYKEFLETINFGERKPSNLPLLALLINNVYTILGAMGGNIKVNPQVQMFVDNVSFLIITLNDAGEAEHAKVLKKIFDDSKIASKVA